MNLNYVKVLVIESVDKKFVVLELGINKIILIYNEFKKVLKVNVGNLVDNKNFVVFEDKLNKIVDLLVVSKIVDKNFVVLELKLGNIVLEYKEINNCVNVVINNLVL